jgi:hypothetical protein
MLSLLGVAVLVVGLAGFLAGSGPALSGATSPSPPRRTLTAPLACCLILLFFLLTIPATPPWASGMRLGLGFLVGGALALIALWLAEAAARRAAAGPGTQLALLSLSLLGATALSLVFRGYPNDALIGFALGAVLVALIARLGDDAAVTPALDWYALVSILLGAGQLLAVQHGNAASAGGRMLPVMFGAALVVGLLLSTKTATEIKKALLYPGGLASALAVLLLYLAGLVRHNPTVLTAANLTLAAALVGAVLTRLLATKGVASKPLGALGAALLVILLLLVAYKQMAGLGIALALLACLPWLAYSMSQEGEAGAAVTAGWRAALQLGAMVLIYRAFLEVVAGDRVPDLQQQYALLGLLLGAGLPLALAAAFPARAETALGRGLVRTGLILVAVFLIPAATYVLWDYKALLGLLFGLCAGQYFMLYLTVTKRQEGGEAPLAGTVALLAGLLAVQFTHLLTPLASLPRGDKVWVMVVLAAVAALWLWVQAGASPRPTAEGGSDHVV